MQRSTYLDEEESSTAEDYNGVNEKRLSEIIRIAKDDIKNNRLKREREDFNSDAEYRIYLSDLAGEVYYMKQGIETMSQWISERCLYINEFLPENVIQTDEGERYDWGAEGRVYDGSWPINDKKLDDYLGKPTYGGYEGYPVSCCWKMDRESVLKLAETFPDVIHSLDRSILNKEQYVVIWCHWD